MYLHAEIHPSRHLTAFNKIFILLTNIFTMSTIVSNDINDYAHKANNRNTKKMFEICSKLITKTPERHH